MNAINLKLFMYHAGDGMSTFAVFTRVLFSACRFFAGHDVRGLLSFKMAINTGWQPLGSASAFRSNWFVIFQLIAMTQALEAYVI